MGDKIRVVMAGRYPWEQGKPLGGPEAVAEVLGEGLASSGQVELHVLTMKPGEGIRRRRTPAGAEVYALPPGRFGTWTGYLADRRRILALVDEINPDLVHVQATMGPFAYSLLGRMRPAILAIRGIFFREVPFMKGGVSGLKERIRARYERAAITRARNLIFLNRYTERTVARYTGGANVRYIDNPADDAFFGVENCEEEGRIVLAAVFRKLKGIDHAVQAMAQLKSEGRNVSFHILGAMGLELDYDRVVLEMIADLGLSDTIHLAGNVSRADVMKHYSRASVVILPSLIENAPVALSEAMAAGKACVATPAGGVPEMIDDGKTGIVVPFSDPEALAAAIAKLLDSADIRKEMGAAAQSVAEQRFRREVAVSKTLAFYRDVLGVASQG